MHSLRPGSKKRRLASSVSASLVACSMLLYTPTSFGQNGSAPKAAATATPIKHVIIIVGENRSFDHVYATYVAVNKGEKVLNLLSEGIIDADGTTGANFAQAQQFQVTSAPNGGKYFVSASDSEKILYPTLPPPDLAGTPPFPSSCKSPVATPGCPQPTNSCLAPAARS